MNVFEKNIKKRNLFINNQNNQNERKTSNH